MSASSRFTIYTPDEVIITFGHITIVSGKGEDEFLRIEQEPDDTADVAGVDGEVAMSRLNDKRTDMVLTLLASSAHNDELAAVRSALVTVPGMVGGVLPFFVRDLNGRTFMTAANCWIKKPPTRTFKGTISMNEWPLRCAHLVRYDGGN